MAERVAVGEISNKEGRKLLSIVRTGSGSVVRWRRAQIVLWSAQHMDVPAIAKIARSTFEALGCRTDPMATTGAVGRPT